VNAKRIYLDNAATTPVRAEVEQAMREAADGGNYNPSSLHAEGRRARAVLDDARARIAAILGAAPKEITFTASGTEGNNLSLMGVARALDGRRHIVASAIEHHSVLEPLERLREEGFRVTLLPVARDGRVDPQRFAEALEPETGLAAIMYANNEVGTVQPIAELAAIARERGVLVHTDAVQAPSWLPVDVRELGIDMLSLSAHKFGGGEGVGLLYARGGVPLAPILSGGGQEFGRRSGTENVVGIAGMARGLELAATERAVQAPRIAALRDRLEAGISSALPEVHVNGGGAPRLANILNVSFAGVDSATLLIGMDLAGLAVSAGSACTSGTLEPSHVLQAMGLEERLRGSALRFSLGAATSAEEIERVLEIVPRMVTELRGDG